MRPNRQQPKERELVALADGSLPAEQRLRVERAVAESPELQAILAAQRRALAAIALAAEERAPAALRAQLELTRGPRREARPRRAFRLIPAGAIAGAVAAAVLVLALAGSVSSPTVAQAAVLATRPAVTAAPPPVRGTPVLAGLKAAGLPYPYWGDQFGFRATGVRHDRIDGRPATTVFYTRGTEHVAYTIVAGRALAVGARSSSVVRDGVWVRALRAHGMRVVTWLRGGHSCVLVGQGTSFRVMVGLASWRGDGRIPY